MGRKTPEHRRHDTFPSYEVGDSGERPWGRWQVLDVQPTAVVKKLILVPHGRISLQRHQHRMERWIVINGIATVQREDDILHLKVGDSVSIPCGCKHRLSNNKEYPLIVIEIQLGSLLSEEDIERLTDDYGRVDND